MELHMRTETSLSPEQVVAALTDFSERRPEMWTGISREHYKVHSVGETSADIQEGTKRGPLNIWARERYDWSTQNTVSWTVVESNFCTPGSYVKAEMKPRDGGGSIIETTWDRTGTSFAGKMIVRLMKLTGGKAIEKSTREGLANYERELQS